MSINETYHSQSTSILSIFVDAALLEMYKPVESEEILPGSHTKISRSKEDLGPVLQALMSEAVHKLCRLFLECTSVLQTENETLKTLKGNMVPDTDRAVGSSLKTSENRVSMETGCGDAVLSTEPGSNDAYVDATSGELPVAESDRGSEGTEEGVRRQDHAKEGPVETETPGESPPELKSPDAATVPDCLSPVTARTRSRRLEAKASANATTGECERKASAPADEKRIFPRRRSRHQCDECGLSFHLVSLLRNHQRVHTGERPFGCGACDKAFARRTSLNKHLLTHGENDGGGGGPLHARRVRGETSGEEKAPESRGSVPADAAPFGCHVCGRGFATESGLATHRRAHARGGKTFDCGVCGKHFTQSGYLAVHKRIHAADRPFQCERCAKGFVTERALNSHRIVHTGVKAHECEQCGKAFGHLVNLKRHGLIHTGSRPYLCTVCGKRFNQSSILKGHMQVHAGSKPFMCELCGRAFVYHYALRKHQRAHGAVPEGGGGRGGGGGAAVATERPARGCETCGKTFSSASALRIHRLLHTGQKPYACGACGKAFAQKSACATHQKVHTQEKAHVCEVCHKGFALPNSLKLHRRTHTGERPYACETCGLTFNIGGNLKRHARIHTGERPFGCQACGKRFSQANNLKAHMQVHTGERPYRCDECGKSFAYVRNFKEHKCARKLDAH